MRVPSRRRYIACVGTALLGLAGCAGDGSEPAATPGETQIDRDDVQTDAQATETATEQEGMEPSKTGDGTETSAGTATDSAPSTDELDLREANVVGVEVSAEGDGRYRFDVTLHHDDDGEDGYANWWQVETLDGERLGRRDLLHAHSQQPFTRSATIDVPDDVDCVVVRGHDQTHEYGGQAMVVTLDSGATHAVQQGEAPDSFEDVSCPA